MNSRGPTAPCQQLTRAGASAPPPPATGAVAAHVGGDTGRGSHQQKDASSVSGVFCCSAENNGTDGEFLLVAVVAI